MTFEEVIPALLNKKRIKRKSQKSEVFLLTGFNNKVTLRRGYSASINKEYGFSGQDILATDWEVL